MRLVKLDPIVKLSRKSTNYRFHASATGCFDAENAVDLDDLKPKTIGWGGCRERVPLASPGRTPNLVVVEEGEKHYIGIGLSGNGRLPFFARTDHERETRTDSIIDSM